jgi:hypothetical protein
MRRLHSLTLVAVVAAGCDYQLAPDADLPLQVTVEATWSKLDPVVEVTAVLRNLAHRGLTIRVQCSPIAIDRDENGAWVRLEDLRLCAPPDRMEVPALTSLTISDQRLLSPGRYRVVIEAIDGREAHSSPFTIPAVR